MNGFKKFLILLASASSFVVLTGAAQAQEAADVFVKRISSDVLASAKSNDAVKQGNTQTILTLVEQKIIPYVDFQRMTKLAAGRYWTQATPDQQQKLVDEFRSLLIYTYSGALSKVSDQQINFLPLRAGAADTEVEVRSQVIQPRGQPIQLNYRLEKVESGWKIYDVNIFGAWLVESYKNTFSSEISKGGIDGLIKALSDKNKERVAAAK